jgi:hypothetical protein
LPANAPQYRHGRVEWRRSNGAGDPISGIADSTHAAGAKSHRRRASA